MLASPPPFLNMVIAALSIAVLIPILALYGIYLVDAFRSGAGLFIALSFAGGIIAYVVAAQINPAVINAGILSSENVVRYFAPILEEILKVLILFFLVRQARFNYFVDGAIYGFAAGIAFAVVENFEYVMGSPETAMMQAIGRVLSTNLMHATGSAMIGIAFGLSRFETSKRRVLTLLSGFTLAMIVHVGFNNLVTRVDGGLLLLYAVITGMGGAWIIRSAIRRGLKKEQSQMEQTLKAEERVTAQEASAVHQIDQMKVFIKPIAEKFGVEKAKKVETFLRMQGRLGIMNKSVASFEKLGDEKLRRSTEKQIESLREEMEALRRSVGVYCMGYLRGTFLQKSSPLWGRLETLIVETPKTDRAPNAPNLWGNLDTKLEKK